MVTCDDVTRVTSRRYVCSVACARRFKTAFFVQVVSLGLPLGKAIEFLNDVQQQQQQQEQLQQEQEQLRSVVIDAASLKLGEDTRTRTPLSQRNV